MQHKILAYLFFVPFIALLLWTGWLYYARHNGTDIRVVITGYDPRDLLSGHFIQYTIDWQKTNCTQFKDNICPEEEFCKEARWGKQCRFYIPQNYAKELDKLFRNRSQNDMIFEVVYSYHKGIEPLAKQLLINGKDWHESIEK